VRTDVTPSPRAEAAPLRVRHYEHDDSVFLDDDYLIKGVAGACSGSCCATTRRTRAPSSPTASCASRPTSALPDVGDNLEARLVLLTRRLVDRQACVRLEKTGRGRFRLCVTRPLQLVNVRADALDVTPPQRGRQAEVAQQPRVIAR
jgi:hypothetical protein